MGDLNFFDDYLEKKEIKLNQNLLYFIVLGGVCILSVGYIAYNSFLIRSESKIVNSLALMAENPEVLNKVDKITQKETQLSELRDVVDNIKIFDTIVKDKEQIDENLIEEINDNIPDGIFVTSLNIQKDEIYIMGISRDKWSVAEFQKNLKSLEDYEELFVSHIALEDNGYNFALDMTLRGEEDEKPDEEEDTEAPADEGAEEQ